MPDRKEKIMEMHTVTRFRPYPFHVGQKIHIEGGPRRGDWQVVGLSDRKVRLRCPVSFKEFEWDLFCYFAEDRQQEPWPRRD